MYDMYSNSSLLSSVENTTKIHLIIGLQYQQMYCKDCNAFRYFSMTKIKSGLIDYVQQPKYYQTKASEFQG